MNNKSYWRHARTFILACAFAHSVGADAYARSAELVMFPTRIIMDKGTRTTTVTLKNTGDASGNYTIDLIDMIMPEDGPVREPQSGETVWFSSKPMMRISPRSVTIEPGQIQNIRILARLPQNLEDGEYRSHLRVTMVSSDADAVPDPTGSAIRVKANLALVIPLIVRKGETNFTTTLSDATLTKDGDKPAVRVVINREGNQSSMGDFKIMQNGKLLGELNGLPVYRPTKKRSVVIPLDKAPGKGTIEVLYNAQVKEGEQANTYAKTTLTN